MLPSSHLLLYESSHEAADRILREQLRLGWNDLRDVEKFVFSEVYGRTKHWDTEFVFRAGVKGRLVPRNPAWTELEFLDVARLTPNDFARSHYDIISETRKTTE